MYERHYRSCRAECAAHVVGSGVCIGERSEQTLDILIVLKHAYTFFDKPISATGTMG